MFGAVIKEFERRLRALKMLVLLRTSDQDADTADLLTMLDSSLLDVEADVGAVREMMADEWRAIEAAKELGHAAHLQAARVQAMQARLPAHLPGDSRLAAERAAHAARAAHPPGHAAACAPLATAHQHQYGVVASERRPLGENVGRVASYALNGPGPAEPSADGADDALKQRKGAPPVPTIPYLTTDELASAPAYMRTRVSVEKANAAVDEVQEAFRRKYELMRAPGRSLAAADKKVQAAYKQFEMDHPKLKGLLFVSEDDLKEKRLVKQDQTGKNILSILRHCQRVKEISAGGLKCWFMI